MKTICLLLIFCGLILLPGQQAQAEQTPVLDRAVQVLIQDDLLTLWSMGITEKQEAQPMDLSHDALCFLLLTDMDKAMLDRGNHPALFAKMPRNYTGYVKKEAVDAVATRVFSQSLRQHHAPRGTIFNGKGYFLDFGALTQGSGNLCGLEDDNLLPGYVSFEVMELQADGSWALQGSMFRFKQMGDKEILWQEASVQAEIMPTSQGWQIRMFRFIEQGMG